ncbi:MAG: hypothetical protein K6C95_01020 [Lachnospiraceae bacterium]|nr:hypothetical protein [Lachnospiraceae bacterium]
MSSFGFGGTNCHVVLRSCGLKDTSKLSSEMEKGESLFITPAVSASSVVSAAFSSFVAAGSSITVCATSVAGAPSSFPHPAMTVRIMLPTNNATIFFFIFKSPLALFIVVFVCADGSISYYVLQKFVKSERFLEIMI